MRIFIWVLATFLLLTLQLGVLAPLHIAPVNLILIFLILALLSDRLQSATIIALSGGLMLDFLSSARDGMITLAFLSTLAIIYFLLEVFLNRQLNNLILGVSVAGGTWIFALCLFVSNWVFNWFDGGQLINFRHFATEQIFWSLLFNLILAYPVWKYLSLVELAIAKFTKN
jgi:hypothetical protein